MLKSAPLVLVLGFGFGDASAQSAPNGAPRAARDETSLEIYDVRDLALPSGLRRLIPQEEAGAGTSRAADDAATAARAESALVKLLHEQARAKGDARDGVAADLAAWKLIEALVQCVGARRGGVTSCQAKESGALVVQADGAAHRAIQQLLAALRRSEDSLPVELRVVELDRPAQELVAGFASAHGTDASAQSPASAATLVTDLTPPELERLLAHAGARVGVAPRVITPQLDGFEIEVAESTSYVASFALTSIEGIGTVADPVIKVARPGTKVRGRCVAAAGLADGDAPPYALRLEVEVSALKQPIATQKTELGTIQLPEIRRALLSSTVAGTTGRTLLIGGVPKPGFDEADATRRLYVLVTVGAPRHGG